jgi:hypothetical protein
MKTIVIVDTDPTWPTEAALAALGIDMAPDEVARLVREVSPPPAPTINQLVDELRALAPRPRNRHERRAAAAMRRKSGAL